MKYDLHIHSKYSADGLLEPKRIVEIARTRGLSGIAVTDHDTIKGALKAKKYETDDFKVICGSEISTERGEVIGLFLSSEITSHSFMDVVDEIHDQEGIIIIPHPFDNIRRNGIHLQKGEVKLINCIEVFNSRCLNQKYNDNAILFAQENKLVGVAGSDAHFAREIGKAGVIIREPPVKNAILSGNFDLFGEKSTIVNLAATQMIKTWRDCLFYFKD
jgi:predicted metal-dependent phosphoesterase TrpH